MSESQNDPLWEWRIRAKHHVTTAFDGREWVHPEYPNFYLHHFKEADSWAVIDMSTDLAVTDHFDDKTEAVASFLSRSGITMSARDVEGFVRESEERLYDLHANCLSPRNPPPITLQHCYRETYSRGKLEEGVDTLGLYGEKNEIRLFEQNIANFAGYSGLSEELITQIVLIHEIAHSVTHLGLYEGKIWEDFWAPKICDRSQREHFAQLASWLYLKNHGTDELMKTFTKISAESQPGEYRTWEKYVKERGRAVEDVLRDYKSDLLYESGRKLDKEIITRDFEE